MFLSPAQRAQARENIRRYPWAAAMEKPIVETAQRWMRYSDDELWEMMFSNSIKRAWQVWSDGYCPACKKSVPMYNWVADALEHPWKMRCPHCKELFPKNDFLQFYRSGLNAQGLFDPARADRSLLFNAEHPDPDDPLHTFGVDDGEGYVADGHRWRFIGAYLIFGQWKQAVLGGIRNLAAAYVVTGDRRYAHKAGVLLDRVADLYPTFDFGKEGVMYEGAPRSGYISTWHDACEETRELALAYDMVFDALKEDRELIDFLSRRARQAGLSNPKATWEDIQRNIEDRILRDALNSRDKIYSNYPRTDICVATILAVLGWPHNREQVYKLLDAMLEKATAVDGVTGEKGLSGYTAYATQGVALVLAQFARLDARVLPDLYQRHPKIHQMFRFHIDTWCFQHYYPLIGDTGAFARQSPHYVGVSLSKNPGVGPSMFAFLWDLYELTGDAAFVQVIYHANGDTVEGLPYDLFAADPAAIQRKVQAVIAQAGTALKVGSVNKEQWHLAILRGGGERHPRALWLDYDAGGGHGHADGMNLGLFAKGLDLLPDFGYPPVNYGGWGAPRALWYTMTAAHNTVVVDGKNQRAGGGKTTLWADGLLFRAIRASAPELIGGKQYERTAAMIDISDRDFYVVDIFRVAGGADHAKFLRSHFGTISTQGLTLQTAPDYGHNTLMRDFRFDAAPEPGWSVDWKIEDVYGYLPRGSRRGLRYTDFTRNAQAYTCETWVSKGSYEEDEEAWLPTLMVRRQAKEGTLASTFVGVLEPYEQSPPLRSVRRLPLHTSQGDAYPESCAAVEAQLADGSRDLLIAADAENPLALSPSLSAQGSLLQKEWRVVLAGELCWIRRDAQGRVKRIALCKARSLRAGDVEVTLREGTDFVEIAIVGQRAVITAGEPQAVAQIRIGGKMIPWQPRGGGE